MTRWVSLGEDISRLLGRRDGEQLEIAFLEMLASDVAINLNVLSVFIEDIVMSNVDSTTIITIKRSGSGQWSIHVSQEPSKLDKLDRGVSKGMILSLGIGTRNHVLLLATPWDKRSTQQETKTCDGASVSWITCLI